MKSTLLISQPNKTPNKSLHETLNPYQLALEQIDYSVSGYSKEEWEVFYALVNETESIWRKAKYSTNVRLLLNHRYQSSVGMNTHEK
jgi:hypothetical protein